MSTENDSEDLQDLFDSIVAANAAEVEEAAPAGKAAAPADPAPAVAETGNCAQDAEDYPAGKVIASIGHLTRSLHDALRELGYDKVLEKTAAEIPDTRDRLNYVATMTEQAAERALSATEVAKPLQEKLEYEAVTLSAEWRKLFDRQLSVEEFKSLVGQTCHYLDEVPNHTRATNAQLLEIMMAQDFQDLTGQVIKKITQVAQDMERQLVQLLVENVPLEKRGETDTSSLLNGPVVNAKGRSDVVTSQGQVDELLASLGF